MQRLQKRSSFSVSILVADMDNLKKINDNQDHQAGATALQTMAEICRNPFRDEDVVAHIGGDDLAVILPNSDERAARQAINRLGDALAY